MKALSIGLSVLFSVSMAHAAQYKNVKSESGSKRNPATLEYPELLESSVPGYATINANILKSLEEGRCDEPEADRMENYYYANATVVALNKAYVGIRIAGDNYCGGAHPNNYTIYLTFDSNTGSLMDVEKEFGITEDYEANSKIQSKIADLLIKKMPKDEASNCFEDQSAAEIKEQMEMFYPVVHGLAKNKTVVLGIMPPHVASVCRFEARFSYDEVKSLIQEGSYLHQLLK